MVGGEYTPHKDSDTFLDRISSYRTDIPLFISSRRICICCDSTRSALVHQSYISVLPSANNIPCRLTKEFSTITTTSSILTLVVTVLGLLVAWNLGEKNVQSSTSTKCSTTFGRQMVKTSLLIGQPQTHLLHCQCSVARRAAPIIAGGRQLRAHFVDLSARGFSIDITNIFQLFESELAYSCSNTHLALMLI